MLNSTENEISTAHKNYKICGPDLGPSCLQRLSVDDKSRRYQGKS